MRKVFFCAAIALCLSLAGFTPRALAEDPNRLSQLKISVWPEYDQPTVLVMLDGTLADPANLPREVSVLIPSTASLLVTTYENTDGSLAAEQSSKPANQGDGWTRVTYSVRTSKYHVEYYDNLLRGSPDKTLDFAFKAVAPVDQVSVEIQQPLKATSFTVTPAAQNTRNENGFNYYTLPSSALTAGQTVNAQVKYTKTDPSPSVLPTAIAPASPQTAPAASSSPSIWNNLFLVVVLAVLGLMAILGFIVLQQRSRQAVPVRSAPSRKSRRGTHRRGTAAGENAFCTECGNPLKADDNFCPRCGARRRAV